MFVGGANYENVYPLTWLLCTDIYLEEEFQQTRDVNVLSVIVYRMIDRGTSTSLAKEWDKRRLPSEPVSGESTIPNWH